MTRPSESNVVFRALRAHVEHNEAMERTHRDTDPNLSTRCRNEARLAQRALEALVATFGPSAEEES